ncbi:MAG: T9SS type A sorting domain-containing protein, partial [Bacteroidia bacterium]
LNWSLANNVAISKLTMSPSDPKVLFAATTLGLYRTTNGGTNWSLVQSAYHSDVVFRPNDANVVYTAINDYWGISQIYKSIDAGTTWTQISSFTDNYNWIQLAVTPANPNKLVVMCSHPNKNVYVSNDNGATFTFKSNAPMGDVIAVSPVNENRIYCGQIVMHQSLNEGTNWTQICDWYNSGSYPEVHADHRFLAFHPLNNQLYSCNDGGIHKLNETTNIWTELTNGLLITQFYKIAVSQNDPAFMIGGTQDNGGRKMISAGVWDETNGGDGMEVAIDPVDDNIFYTTYVDGKIYRTLDGWNNDTYNDISDNIQGGQPQGEWVTPYLIDPNNPNRLLAGYHEIYATNNRGNTWTALTNNLLAVDEKFDQLAVFEGDSDIIFASNHKTLYKTINGGANWTTINPPVNAEITNITLHPTDPTQIWLSYGAYQTGKKVYKSVNGGTNWTNYSTGLPNVPVNCLVYVKNSNNLLFAGNDYQVYYRDASMANWQLYGQGLPSTMITDLEIQYPTNTLRAASYGRGIWEVPIDMNVVSIENAAFEMGNFFVYPNPNRGEFQVKLPKITANTQLLIENTLGQCVHKQELSQNHSFNQLSLLLNLPEGIYFLTLQNAQGTRTEKMVVR